MLDKSLSEVLSRLCPGGVHCNVPLAQISRWQIGGNADVVVEPGSVAELSAVRAFISTHGFPSIVIGDTSNLLFADEGLRAICIRIGSRLSQVIIEGTSVKAEAGIWVPYLARKIMQAGLTGAEHTCGIPGTLGGLICMNGGSQRKGIGSIVKEVMGIGTNGEVLRFTQEDCGFGYRVSVFQRNDVVITSCRLQFKNAQNPREVRKKMLSILRDRRMKFPRKQPNCGSVFKSNPVMYAEIGPPGAVIEQLGFKGMRIGGAQVSLCHANFIINLGDATAHDVLTLIRQISQKVFDTTGFRMESEVCYVTPGGRIIPADQTKNTAIV
jgi:UDP-N-acetylmuramate dehydrogenase